MVCLRKPDDEYWLRGRILEIKPSLKIASLDEGSIITQAATIIPLPQRYQSIKTFSAIMETESPFPIVTGSSTNAEIIKRNVINGECILRAKLIRDGLSSIEVNLKPWQIQAQVPAQTQHPPLIGIEIKNKSQVIIQAHRGPSIVFLRSLDDHEVEKFNRLCQDVAKASLTAKNLMSMPKNGDLVLAKYLDDNYYRALVLTIEGETIKIGYIDFGNNETTVLSKLKTMPDDLMSHPRMSIKAVLKGIHDVPPTKEAIDHLGKMVAKEELFICTYDGTIDNGVTLTTPNRESLNDFINELLTPSHQREPEPEQSTEEIFTLDNIVGTELGTVGETVDIIFLETIEPGSRYVFAPVDPEAIAHISTVLPEQLQLYCEATPHYIPRNNELCIAKFDDGWYRGVCINPSFGPDTAEIYFVDYGNIAITKHEDIRKMTKDYLQPPALGVICGVHGENFNFV